MKSSFKSNGAFMNRDLGEFSARTNKKNDKYLGAMRTQQ